MGHTVLYFNVGECGWHRWHTEQFEIPLILSNQNKNKIEKN